MIVFIQVSCLFIQDVLSWGMIHRILNKIEETLPSWGWLFFLAAFAAIVMIYLFWGVFNAGGLAADPDTLVAGALGMTFFLFFFIANIIALIWWAIKR